MNFLVYGWKESNTKFVIEFDWLFNNGIRRFKSNDCAVYGIKCESEHEMTSGQIDIVRTAFDKATDYNNYFFLKEPIIGYYVAFTDFTIDHDIYDADTEDNNEIEIEKEKEKENENEKEKEKENESRYEDCEWYDSDTESYIEYIPEYDSSENEIYENDVFE
jgi:hypothetical protein